MSGGGGVQTRGPPVIRTWAAKGLRQMVRRRIMYINIIISHCAGITVDNKKFGKRIHSKNNPSYGHGEVPLLSVVDDRSVVMHKLILVRTTE